MQRITVLLVEPDEAAAQSCLDCFSAYPAVAITRVRENAEAERVLHETAFDAMMLSARLSSCGQIVASAQGSRVPVLAAAEESRAHELIAQGAAFVFLSCPTAEAVHARLCECVRRARMRADNE